MNTEFRDKNYFFYTFSNYKIVKGRYYTAHNNLTWVSHLEYK